MLEVQPGVAARVPLGARAGHAVVLEEYGPVTLVNAGGGT